jgi:YebC/PmpR family DNA-binding regulatory protein
MSGHSKWSSIKHKKGAADAKRGQLFTKLARAIQVTARDGGPDPAGNAALATAVQKARDASMPKDNIERAIAKGAGNDAEAAAFEGATYEGYAPGGVALLVEALTDNRNRTGSEVRHLFGRNGGSLGEPGSVAWNFAKKGVCSSTQSATTRTT